MESRRTLRLYWGAVGICTVLLAWWVYFFSQQGHILVRRIAASGQNLDPAEEAAVRDAADHTLRMFVFEGGFLGLLLVASVGLVVRSLRREIEVNRQQRNFLSAVTHELRSPLASARLYLESIALGRAEGEKQARYLTHAREDLERLRRLVEEMLASARLTEGQAVLVREQVALGAFVQERMGAFTQSPLGHDVELGLTLDADPVVSADLEALAKIVDNLVSNAIKYGGPSPRVDVRVAVVERPSGAAKATGRGWGRIEVRDHGAGLAGADARAIFEPFVRGGDEDVRKSPGVGLGLFLVKQLAQAHGGAVGVEDAAGGGARFWVELPLAPEREPDATDAEPAASVSSEAAS